MPAVPDRQEIDSGNDDKEQYHSQKLRYIYQIPLNSQQSFLDLQKPTENSNDSFLIELLLVPKLFQSIIEQNDKTMKLLK